MSRNTDTPRIEGDSPPDRKEFIQIAGAALAELNIIAPSDSLLEPVARAIYDLSPQSQSDEHQWKPC